MKKNDLIKLLNTIEGNPDVALWNGFVGDYQDISKELVKGDLVKMSLDWYLEMCRIERCIDAYTEAIRCSIAAGKQAGLYKL